MKVKSTRGEAAFRMFSYAFIILFSLICLYPFWHSLMASFSEEGEFMRHTGFLLTPAGFSLDAYRIVFQTKTIWSGFVNSIFMLVVGVSLNMILTCLGAYVFSRKNVLFKKPLILFCMFTMYFSPGTIPMYLNFKDLHLTGTLWGPILGFAIGVYQMIVMKTAFESIPEGLSDAAKIDGAGHITTLFKIVLPLSKASAAVVALQYGVSIWNGWFWSTTLISDKDKLPLQAVLRTLLIKDDVFSGGGSLTLETVQYAIIVVSIAPVMLVYPKLQKFFSKGVMVGSVKE